MAQQTLLKGIDVSVNNGIIDWTAVKAGGVDFAMIKATQGHSLDGKYHYFTESRFKSNADAAYSAELPFGVYHYLTANTAAESIKEADCFISAVMPYKMKIKLWAAVDVEEDKYLPNDKTLLTTIVKAFCDRLISVGFMPIIYTNPNYLKFRMNSVSEYPLWLALWRDKSRLPTVKEYPNLKIWQYGGESVPGVKGICDVNLGIDLSMAIKPPVISSDYASLVCEKCGLDANTKAYLNNYKYADALWRKLYAQM